MYLLLKNSLDGSGKRRRLGAERSEAQQPAGLGANSKTGADPPQAESDADALQENNIKKKSHRFRGAIFVN